MNHYDELKKEYHAKKEVISAVQNKKEVLSFEDTGCVKGSWGTTAHQTMVSDVGNYNNVKLGARFPDTKKEEFGGEYSYGKISSNPWWHGSYNTNYVASYIYETRVANSFSTGKAATAPNGLLSKTKIDDDIERITDKNYWDLLYTTKASPGTKRAFVWGMAIHNLADAFAHSAFVYENGAYHHLDHEKKLVLVNGKYEEFPKDKWECADSADRYRPRYQNACDAVRSSLAKYADKDKPSGTYVEFRSIISNGNVYLLKELAQNINAVDSNVPITTYAMYTYTQYSTDACAAELLAKGLASSIPGSAAPYK